MIEWSQVNWNKATDIMSIEAAPPGWRACYLADFDPLTREGKLVVLPITLWGLVASDDSSQEIRHFVVHANGEVVDYQAVEMSFVCVVPPGQDPERTVEVLLQSEGTEVVVGQARGLPS